jgi:hypothetical protein
MLPEKLASMVSTRDDLAAAALSTPRIVARVRGKALHYGCALPFVAVAAPSLLHLMHNWETGTEPVAVPSLDEEKAAVFDWDRELQVSERAQRALDFMRTAVENQEKYGHSGQPLWPVVPSSLYGAFLAGEERDAHVLVITFDASVHGWTAVLRTAPDEPGVEVVGGYRTAVDLLINPEPAALPDCPAVQVYREVLAGFLATQAACKLYLLAD